MKKYYIIFILLLYVILGYSSDTSNNKNNIPPNYEGIHEMEERIIANYSNKPYPLLTEQEILLVNNLVKDGNLHLLNNEAYIIIDNYLKAKKQVNDIETFVTNNKANIDNNDLETIQNLLDIASIGTFGIDTTKPIYSAMTIDNGNCIAKSENSINNIELIAKTCSNIDRKEEKWTFDPFGRARNYQDQNKCWEITPLNNKRSQLLQYKECTENIKQVFKIEKYQEGFYVVGNDNGNDVIVDKYLDELYQNKITTHIERNSGTNQIIKNINIDNSSMFWLLIPETRILLADILDKK